LVYASATLALATLEVLVHFDTAEAPRDLVAVRADIPDGLGMRTVRLSELPPDWQRHPPPDELARIGSDWIRQARAAVLAVPSVIIPQELNFLLNPRHPEFHRVRIGRPQPFRFDARLWRTR